MIKDYLIVVIKGMGVGAANVIPGVSGGTIALLTGIFQRLIDGIKSFNITAARLVLKGQFKAFAEHTDLYFLIAVFLGAAVSIFSLARLLRFLFDHYPVFIWSYFFGLILASVFFVGKTIGRWNIPVIFFYHRNRNSLGNHFFESGDAKRRLPLSCSLWRGGDLQ